MEKKVKRYFLDYIFDKTEIVLDLGRNFKIEKDKNKNFNLNKFFYKQIGKDHFWRDRLVWTDKEWRKYISNKNFETWIMKKEKLNYLDFLITLIINTHIIHKIFKKFQSLIRSL